jgi:hypothetical protein
MELRGNRILAWHRNVVDGIRRRAVKPASDADQAQQELLRFYDELAHEIASHRDYESQITAGVDRDSPFVKRFALEAYAGRLCDHFRSAGLMSHVTSDGRYFALIMTILYPDEAIRSKLAWGLRRRLFNSVFIRVGEEQRVPLDELSKRYFERIHHTGLDIRDVTREQLLDGLQDALHELAVDTTQARRASGLMPQLTADETDKFLDEWLRRARIRDGRHMVSLMQSGGALAAGASIVTLFIILLGLLFGDETIRTFLGATMVTFDPALVSLIPRLLALITAAAMVAAGIRVGANRQARTMRATLTTLKRTQLTTDEAISGYLRRRYGMELPRRF